MYEWQDNRKFKISRFLEPSSVLLLLEPKDWKVSSDDKYLLKRCYKNLFNKVY